VASWKQQALVEAPVERVWELLADPARFPEWSGETLEVMGVPTRIDKGSSGFYSHWLLTEAQGNTFAEMELGVEQEGLKKRARAAGALHTKGYLRRAAEQTLDGLRRAAGRQ